MDLSSPEFEVVTGKSLGGEWDPTSSSLAELGFRTQSDFLRAHPVGVGQRAQWTLAQGSAKVTAPHFSQTNLSEGGDPSGSREKGLCPLWRPSFLSVGHLFRGAGWGVDSQDGQCPECVTGTWEGEKTGFTCSTHSSTSPTLTRPLDSGCAHGWNEIGLSPP